MAEDILVSNEGNPCSNWRDAMLRSVAARQAEQTARLDPVNRREEAVPAGDDSVHVEAR
jgi:hypothetical protein